MLTSANAVRVPMLTISSSFPIGVNPATTATTVPTARVIRTGVPERAEVLPNPGGSSRSRLIANSTREVPIRRVITTVVRPATAPAEMRVANPSLPTSRNAVASAADVSISS